MNSINVEQDDDSFRKKLEEKFCQAETNDRNFESLYLEKWGKHRKIFRQVEVVKNEDIEVEYKRQS